MSPHPIRLTAEDDLRRSRLTVFFRLLLALPHIVWLVLWTIAALFAALVGWFATLVRGQLPNALHRFLAAYVRYTIHLQAYLFLAANPYPPFTGGAGTYPVDVEIDPPARQNRWTVAFRFLLAVPALVISSAFGGGSGSGGPGASSGGGGAGIATTIAFLGWFVCLVRGRMPRGMRDAQLYGLRYVAQADAYVFLVTGSYPNSNPEIAVISESPPAHAVGLSVDPDELRRSRLTVFFRLLLAFPHFVWVMLWSAIMLVTVPVAWIVTLVRGTPPQALHRFHSAFIRYWTQLIAFLFLVSNPFPGFTGAPGRYPVEALLPRAGRQSRWITFFRGLLSFPALMIGGGLNNLLFAVALFGWFYALVRGRMPLGLRNTGAYALRYSAQVFAYLLLVTDAYPFSGPWQAAPESQAESQV